jgi:2-keto-3-deoxy-L-rhamnonate aldolase RhmA
MKEKLAAAELVLCMNLRLARSVDIAMVAKAGGYDALYVDMQHAPYSIETTATICAAALGRLGPCPACRNPFGSDVARAPQRQVYRRALEGRRAHSVRAGAR